MEWRFFFLFINIALISNGYGQIASWNNSCDGENANALQPGIFGVAMLISHDCSAACLSSIEGALQGDQQGETVGDDQSFSFGITNFSGQNVELTGLSYAVQRSSTGFNIWEIELFINGVSQGIIDPSETWTGTSQENRTSPAFSSVVPNGFTAIFVVTVSGYQGNTSLQCNVAGNNGTFRFISPQILGSLLPVELTNFKVEKKQNKAQLTWNTATETNNDYFVIEHAADGNHFSAIGKVAGAGTTLTAQQYIFTHDSPKPGANYYRLKQVDFDGAFEYSRVVAVNFENPAIFRLRGNPVATQLEIEWQEPLLGAVAEIISAQGVLLAVKNIEEEILSQQFDVSDLPAGHYFIRLKSAKFSEVIPFQKL